MDLLFELATWHALAKLRLHTETTLNDLDNATTTLGRHLRKFVHKTCSSFSTKELPGEEAARGRRKAAKVAATSSSSTQSTASSGAKTKKFNLSTYKLHALGDYVKTIHLFGTTDSYTTQVVSIYACSV